MHELKATVLLAVLAGLAVCSGCSNNHGSNLSTGISTHSVSVAAEKLLGNGLLMQNNGGDDLSVPKNEKVQFTTRLRDGDTYNVTVASQPTNPSQTCTVSKGSGVIQGKDVVARVTCETNKYTIGGTVTGLDGQVILHNVLPGLPYDSLAIDADGPFTFNKSVKDESDYAVSISQQPAFQKCIVTQGSGTLAAADVNNVKVTCTESIPTVSVKDAGIVEGDAGTSYLDFIVRLSIFARQDVTVDYATSDNTATAGSDYTATSGSVAASDPLTIPTSKISADILVPVLGDGTPEPNETLKLTLTNPSSNAKFSNNNTSVIATGTIYNDDGGVLNDSGITLCGDYATVGSPPVSDNDLDCAAVGATATSDGVDGQGDPVPAGQDAFFGRDFTANDPTDGNAGFSFVKYGSNGQPLANQNVAWDNAGSEAAGSQWSCVLDQTTKLMWETKTSNGLHDTNSTYSWYNSNNSNNGGYAGTPGMGSCTALPSCDTEKFVAAVNTDDLCGHNDWRLPTVNELSSLIDSGASAGPTIDTGWFPNTLSSVYWTFSPYSSYSHSAWAVNFANGSIVGNLNKDADLHYVRLVRGGQ